MRVIAGKYKRRALTAPPGEDTTRPTSDRVKENLFNILSNELTDALVVDLFAGSGALGIEALSRGAKKAIFVEKDRTALKFLQENLNKLNVPKQHYKIIPLPVERFLETAEQTLREEFAAEEFAASINLVLADPPYASPWYDKALESIQNSKMCGEGSLLVLEMASKRNSLTAISPWTLEDEREYGTTKIQFWRNQTT